MNNLWNVCKETGKHFDSFRGFLNHLRTLKMSSKEYYDKHFKKDDEGLCYCGSSTKYYSFSYKKYCSDICGLKSEEHKIKVRERFINNPETLNSFRKLRREKNVNNNVEKRRNTIRQKCFNLGITEFEYYSNHSKKSRMNISSETKKQITLKSMATKQNTNKFGGRSGYKPYDFFGEIVSLQGYEPLVLKHLIDVIKLDKEDICIGKNKVPIIEYITNDKKRLYFPDFYLPKYNLLIEVKSNYTLRQHYNNVMLKCKYSLESGYSIILMVIDKHEVRNNKLDGSKKLLDWAISSQAPNPTWYGEGSTTILNGVESSDSKSNPSNING